MMDVTVEAMQRLKAFNNKYWGAVVSGELGRVSNATRGSEDNIRNVAGAKTFAGRCQ